MLLLSLLSFPISGHASVRRLYIRQEQAKAKMLKERAERKWEAEEYLEAGQSLVLRLAKLAGAAATERNNFRVTDSGGGKEMRLRVLSAVCCVSHHPV